VIHPLDAVRVELSGLVVSPGYRGRGLGRRLVGEVADRLRASGVEQLLAPPAQDAGLAALLAQAGFVALAPGWALLPL
jgi:ribosomal protein S18 acetylase RimI-like enzyme